MVRIVHIMRGRLRLRLDTVKNRTGLAVRPLDQHTRNYTDWSIKSVTNGAKLSDLQILQFSEQGAFTDAELVCESIAITFELR